MSINSNNLVILIHGWGNTGELAFFPELTKNLESKGYSVISPNLPNTEEQIFEDSYTAIKEIIENNPDCTLSLVGHSSGGYLASKLAEKYNFNTIILVAPTSPYRYWGKRRMNDVHTWLSGKALEKYLNFHSTEIDFESIDKKAKNIHILFGLKDPYILESNRNYFIHSLNNRAIITLLEDQAHMGVQKLVEVEKLF